MDTGGGEFLSSLRPLPPNTHATKGYAPNVPTARSRLEPLGIQVHEIEDDDNLPLPDETFDLVVNRHEAYHPAEVRRGLRPGRRFIPQQVGGKDGLNFNKLLEAPNPDSGMPDWDLEQAQAQLEAASFKAIRAADGFPLTGFTDVGAIVYYLTAILRQIPDFTVDRYSDRLEELERRARAEGSIKVRSHRFLIVAEK
jgi:SAM-dependent methyltransferase